MFMAEKKWGVASLFLWTLLGLTDWVVSSHVSCLHCSHLLGNTIMWSQLNEIHTSNHSPHSEIKKLWLSKHWINQIFVSLLSQLVCKCVWCDNHAFYTTRTPFNIWQLLFVKTFHFIFAGCNTFEPLVSVHFVVSLLEFLLCTKLHNFDSAFARSWIPHFLISLTSLWFC